MRRQLFAALLLLCCAYGCIAATRYESPYPPDPDAKSLPETGDTRVWGVKVAKVDPEEVAQDGWQNIRIAVNPAMIQRALRYCENKGNQGKGPTKVYNGFDEEVCEAVKGKDENIRTVVTKVIPEAIALHVERLKVKRVQGPLKINVPFDLRPVSDAEGTMCAEMVPAFDGDNGMGIPNADFVIYLGLSTKKPSAKICSYDKDGRPTSAMIKLNPRTINNTDQYVRVVAHEVAHGLGFTTDLDNFKKMVRSGRNSSYKGHDELMSSKIMEKVQFQYQCFDVIGMKLDNSTSRKRNNADVHFDGYLAQHELMAPLWKSKSGKRAYTALTLAAFESTGYYRANYRRAENVTLGVNKTGCHNLGRR